MRDRKAIVVISPIQVNDTIVSQLSELGTISHIIAPNLYHYLFAANFKKLYPNAKFWAAPGLEAKKPDLSIELSKVMQTVCGTGWNMYFSTDSKPLV